MSSSGQRKARVHTGAVLVFAATDKGGEPVFDSGSCLLH